MWRSCSSMVAAIPAAVALLAVLDKSAEGHAIKDNVGTFFAIILTITTPLYPIARLFLITIPFASLRALPPGVFVSIDWNAYIPHL
ncbi:hypothetical protein C8R44DRAFT_778645 [Mycena epipterygia]|nr:hypothetical protein C8R44DRAFT_778645 [Mycena epipterygia]